MNICSERLNRVQSSVLHDRKTLADIQFSQARSGFSLMQKEVPVMLVTVIGKKCTPRDSFKERAEKKLSKIDRFFGEEAEAKVTATVEKSSQTVEVAISHDGMIYRAQAKAPNMNEALDECVDLLIRQIRKNKTKIEKRLRSGAFDNYVPEEDAVEEEKEFEVVRTKAISLKPLSVDEAILQMNMLGHSFFMFRNAETEDVCVVYQRQDGGYGLLEPSAD